MTKAYERLLKCYQCFKDKINFKPEVALVLGSGLGDYADTIRVEAVLDYHDIEGFPVSTVSGHKGRFVFGYVRIFHGGCSSSHPSHEDDGGPGLVSDQCFRQCEL